MGDAVLSDKLMKSMLDLEIALVTGSHLKFDSGWLQSNLDDELITENFVTFGKFIFNGDYESLLNSCVLDEVFKGAISENDCNSLSNVMKSAVEYVRSNVLFPEAKSSISHYVLLFAGISGVQEFVRRNWTGPSQREAKTYSFLSCVFESLPNCEDDSMKYLSPHHEAIYHNVKNPELLMLSKIFLSEVEDTVVCTRNWWLLRCSMLHQCILLEKSAWLYKEMKTMMETISALEFLHSNVQAHVHLNIECGLMHLRYHEIMPAKHYFSRALELVGLDVELSGAFGKRTQFQSKAVPQLFVNLHRNSGLRYHNNWEENVSHLPKDLSLNDDVLLNKVKFIDPDTNVVQNLLPEEQVVILSQCCLVQKSGASDELLTEQIAAYLDCLLSQPSIWSIQMKALIMRSKLEKKKSRKVERAMMQLESLLGCMQKDLPDLKTRLFMFFSTLFPPYWILEKEFADLLISLGAVKSALDVYLRLELWEEVVRCYQILEQNEKAAAIVCKLLEKQETPTLWCILGDVTNDIELYHKAWELSNCQSARAQRSLGYYYYKKREYKLCIPFFEESLKINHLQAGVWFSLAFAATQVKDYNLASQSYRHVVVMDPDNFEAWNNLSNAYIKLNQKTRAYRTLLEALKCNFEDWRIWENFLLVCIDVGAFEDSIHAWHRLLDIKGKHEDVEILGILVKAITSDTLDNNGQPASRLKQKLLELFGRLTSVVPNNSDIWKLYSKLYSADPEYQNSKDTFERVVNYLHKSHKCTVLKASWEKDLALCQSIVLDAAELGALYYRYLQMLENGPRSQGKSSAKLMMKNVLVRVEKQLCDFHASDAVEVDKQLELLRETISSLESL